MNYEQYHQKGGTYVIPVEVFDNLLDEKERLEQEKQELIYYLKEKIKEYEEKYNNTCVFLEQDRCETCINTYQEILSKIEKSDK